MARRYEKNSRTLLYGILPRVNIHFENNERVFLTFQTFTSILLCLFSINRPHALLIVVSEATTSTIIFIDLQVLVLLFDLFVILMQIN